jgi:UDP-glucuronate 4-epimerase
MATLVTGGAGFIGSHLVEQLLRDTDDDLVCLDDFNHYYNPALKRANIARFRGHPRVRIAEASFCDPVAMQSLFAHHRFSAIFHLGAYAGVRSSFRQPLVYEEANVRGTLILLELAKEHAVGRFIYASSSTVYGTGIDAPFLEDGDLGTPTSPYAASKRAAELLVLMYHQVHGLPTVILRPFSVYGPRLRPDLAMLRFAEAIMHDRPLVLFGDGSVERDFTFVADICDGFVAALAHDDAIGEAINLGNRTPITIHSLVERLENVLKKPAKIEYRDPIAGDMPLTCADLTKAQKLLGYRPRVGFDEGIQQFADWFLHSQQRAMHEVVWEHDLASSSLRPGSPSPESLSPDLSL